MNEINEQLKGISELVTRIDAKVLEITTKLDELIKALHEYDDDELHCGYSGLPSVKAYDEEATNERMDVIGQNENTGEHYDYDGGFNNNKPANTNVNKKHVKRDKWVSPYPPNPKRNANTNALNIVDVKYRDKMANDHYELGGEG